MSVLSPEELTALLVLSTAASFTPGPNTALSTAIAANQGLRSAMKFIVSVPVGWGLLLTLCMVGVGQLVLAVPALRWLIMLSGTAYLLWLAFKLWGTQQLAQADTQRLNITFLQGVAVQFLNIKAWMLALSVVAGWVVGKDNHFRALFVFAARHDGLWFVQQLSLRLGWQPAARLASPMVVAC
jgi:threonine/homoserine/homoserine lactone efflux protein